MNLRLRRQTRHTTDGYEQNEIPNPYKNILSTLCLG
jgi:hypothetical protein